MQKPITQITSVMPSWPRPRPLYGSTNPISSVLFPFKMMTLEGSFVGTLDDLRERLALVQASKLAPIPIETRPADQANSAPSDLKGDG